MARLAKANRDEQPQSNVVPLQPRVRRTTNPTIPNWGAHEKAYRARTTILPGVTPLFPNLEGKKIGPYRVEGELGSGGMGQVFLGTREDGEFNMKVAIKLIRQDKDTKKIMERFLHERQILADLKHPNIATLIDGGTTEDGLPYLVMKYVEGQPIDDYCQFNELGLKARLELFLKVCRGVAFAHENLIIHRDIKPGNILVAEDGEPIIIDFGIAKILDPSTAAPVTCTGDFMLTPEYASPEQVMGKCPNVFSDIYSLGVLLYEILTGNRPFNFSNGSIGEIQRVICNIDPMKPSQVAFSPFARPATAGQRIEDRWSRQLVGDLDAVIGKALRKEPQHRYTSITAFAADIDRYLNGLPVLARGNAWSYRLYKFSKRNRGKLATTGAFLAMLGSFYLYVQSWQGEFKEKHQQVLAEKSEMEKAYLATSQTLGQLAEERDHAKREAQKTNSTALALSKEKQQFKQERDQARQAWVAAEKDRRTAIITAEKKQQEQRAQVEAEREKAQRMEEKMKHAKLEAERVRLEAEAEKERAQHMMSLVTRIFQEAEQGDVTVNSILAATQTETDGLLEKPLVFQARLMNTAGVIYLSKQRFELAAPLLQESLRLRKSLYQEPHEDLAASLRNLGYLHFLQGQYDLAEPLIFSALVMRKSLYGDRNAKVAASYNQMGLLYDRQKKYDLAWDMFQTALDMQRGLYGNLSPTVAETMANMASMYDAIGDQQQAVKLQQAVVVIFRAIFGNDSPEVQKAAALVATYCCGGETQPDENLPLDIREELLEEEEQAPLPINVEDIARLLGEDPARVEPPDRQALAPAGTELADNPPPPTNDANGGGNEGNAGQGNPGSGSQADNGHTGNGNHGSGSQADNGHTGNGNHGSGSQADNGHTGNGHSGSGNHGSGSQADNSNHDNGNAVTGQANNGNRGASQRSGQGQARNSRQTGAQQKSGADHAGSSGRSSGSNRGGGGQGSGSRGGGSGQGGRGN